MLRLSGGGVGGDDSDDSASYASRALRRFTARAAVSGHRQGDADPGTSTLGDCTDWPPASHHQPANSGGPPDTHLLYHAPATSIHDDIAFLGKPYPDHVLTVLLYYSI